MRHVVTGVAVLLALAVAGSALAGMNFNHKCAIHVKAHPTSCTDGYPTFTRCESIITTYAGTGDLDVMPVFYDLIEFQSVEFGISWWSYPSLSMVWTRCKGDAAVGTIVHSGDGTAITWNACQSAWSVAPGYGWMTIPGTEWICPVRNPVTRRYGVTDCQTNPGPFFDYWQSWRCAGIGGWVGDDPCAPYDAVEKSTWGAIKALVR